MVYILLKLPLRLNAPPELEEAEPPLPLGTSCSLQLSKTNTAAHMLIGVSEDSSTTFTRDPEVHVHCLRNRTRVHIRAITRYTNSRTCVSDSPILRFERPRERRIFRDEASNLTLLIWLHRRRSLQPSCQQFEVLGAEEIHSKRYLYKGVGTPGRYTRSGR